jgi:hypothetical protein
MLDINDKLPRLNRQQINFRNHMEITPHSFAGILERVAHEADLMGSSTVNQATGIMAHALLNKINSSNPSISSHISGCIPLGAEIPMRNGVKARY